MGLYLRVMNTIQGLEWCCKSSTEYCILYFRASSGLGDEMKSTHDRVKLFQLLELFRFTFFCWKLLFIGKQGPNVVTGLVASSIWL